MALAKYSIALLALALSILTSAQAGAKSENSDCQSPYQVVKATADTVWRLNTQTGAIAACRFVGGVMECANEQTAVVRDKTDYRTYRDEQRQREMQEREEDLAFMERMFNMAMKFIRSFIELEKETAQ